MPPSDDRTDDEPPPRAAAPARLLHACFAGWLALRLGATGHAPNALDALFALGFSLLAVAIWLREPPHDAPDLSHAGLGVCVALALCTVTSWHPLLSAFALPALLAPLVVFLVTANLDEPGARWVRWVLATLGAASAGQACYQRFVSWPNALAEANARGLTDDMVQRLSTGRPVGLSLSPDLGGALALIGLIASCTLLSRQERRLRAWAIGTLIACALGMVISRSAGVALASGVFVAMLLGLRRRAQPRSGGPTRWRWAFALIPLLAVLGLGRGLAALRLSAAERWLNWQSALLAFLDDPLTGAGVGRFAATYLAHRLPEGNVTRYAHSAPMHGLAETGLVGVVALSALCFVVARSLGSAWRRGQLTRSLEAQIWLAGSLALLCRCLYDYDAQISQSACALAALWGLTFRHLRPPTAVVTTTNTRRLAATAFCVALATAGLSFWATEALFEREQVLSPFERGGSPRPEDMGRLLSYATSHPEDEAAAVIALRLRTLAYRRCREDCLEQRQQLEDLLDARLKRPHPPAEFAAARVDLALTAGELAEVQRWTEVGLRHDPGHAFLRAVDVALADDASGAQRRAAAADWLSDEALATSVKEIRRRWRDRSPQRAP